ncbi:MAG: DUF2183 domain-containing protein [Chlorobi bacterium]|nr:DUF2183 domain-containing protein [Chlorobiota bacterium]
MAVIWQISAIQFKNKTLIRGIILKNVTWPDHLKTSRIKNIYLVLSSYFRKRYKNKDIIVSTGSRQHETRTDKHGKFALLTENETIKKTDVYAPGSDKPFPIIQSYPVFFPDNDIPVAAISDIDDTILISNTQRMLKSILTVLLVTPRKRKPVDNTANLLNSLHKRGGRVFYVSKSESNLFAMLTYFIQNQQLPTGYLHLTPYISFHQLFKTKGGKNYKDKAIRFILDNSDKKFILLGDDTHKDMRIYLNIAKAYTERIIKIYIRKTIPFLSGSKKKDLSELYSLSIPFVYFTDNDDMSEELGFIESIMPKQTAII